MDEVTLALNRDEALVFFEWLSSLQERADFSVYDESEQKVIWKIEGQLEKMLPDIVLKDYKERVSAAKLRI